MRYALTFSLTIALCFAAQSLTLRYSGGRFTKNESNFFSSIGRIQAGAQDSADVMLLGSSITGRLPDRSHGYAGWANMGCDGGSALDVLRAIDTGILPSAPLLVIEANTLNLALDPKPTEISRAMNGTWFRVGMNVPLLSSYARPSAFFYSKLLERRTGSFDLPEGENLEASGGPEEIVKLPAITLSSEQSRLIGEMKGLLSRLRSRGSRAVIVWLPPARPDDAPPPWILEMARQCEIPFWDLGQQAELGTVTLTDGIHMNAPSAARTMRSLLGAMGNK